MHEALSPVVMVRQAGIGTLVADDIAKAVKG
jgi:hypothetical protein